jgi:hypothetical protein
VSPIAFLDHLSRRGGHDEPDWIARTRERSHGGGRDVAD